MFQNGEIGNFQGFETLVKRLKDDRSVCKEYVEFLRQRYVGRIPYCNHEWKIREWMTILLQMLDRGAIRQSPGKIGKVKLHKGWDGVSRSRYHWQWSILARISMQIFLIFQLHSRSLGFSKKSHRDHRPEPCAGELRQLAASSPANVCKS